MKTAAMARFAIIFFACVCKPVSAHTEHSGLSPDLHDSNIAKASVQQDKAARRKEAFVPQSILKTITLGIDLSNNSATAIYYLHPDWFGDSLVLESRVNSISTIYWGTLPANYQQNGQSLTIDRPINSPTNGPVTIEYQFVSSGFFSGVTPGALNTYTWPDHCAALLPCLSAPANGSTYKLILSGVPINSTAIYPTSLPNAAPAYQLAWAIGDYQYQLLGYTQNGTEVGLWHLPESTQAAQTGAEGLERIFEWYEQTLGNYLYGNQVASVEVDWPSNGGAIEHHPFWHIDSDAIGDRVTHAHEAAHGWFGNGVRLACWEDLTLSEGVSTYLAAVAIGAVISVEEEAAVWESYFNDLARAVANDNSLARPPGCNIIDVEAELFTLIPYMKGAFFLREIERKIGRGRLLNTLRIFYAAYQGRSAGVNDLLTMIEISTGFDPTDLSQAWLYQLPLPVISK